MLGVKRRHLSPGYLAERWRIERETRLIERSGAFDRRWYLARYPDIAGADIDPLRHYVQSGSIEGRYPNPIFDGAWYAETYFPAGSPPQNPLADYLRRRGGESRRPNRWFDPLWYRRTYLAETPNVDPMVHYLTTGGAAGHQPSLEFDALGLGIAASAGARTPLEVFQQDYRTTGMLGHCTAFFVEGWVGRREGPRPLVVVRVNGREAGRVAPWIDRPDVEAALCVAGLGFYFRFPERLRDGDIVELDDEFGQMLTGCRRTYRIPALDETSDLYLNRAAIASRYLFGRGVEVGAFTQPTDLPPDRDVVFYDRYPAEVLRTHYDPNCGRPLMEPTYAGDAETLDGLPDAAFEFFIANHVIEHLQDPIGFLKAMIAKLVDGGRAMIAAPDMRYCGDRRRALTTFAHLVEDHRHGPGYSQVAHFLECARLNGHTGPAAVKQVAAIDKRTLLFHYHVWTDATFVAFIKDAIDRFALPLTLLHSGATRHDIIVVLEKTPPRLV